MSCMFGIQGREESKSNLICLAFKEEKSQRAVSYVWHSRKRRVKEQQLDISHMFGVGVQGREESKSNGWIFLICLASKEANVYIIRLGICILHSHTLQNEGNGFKGTSS